MENLDIDEDLLEEMPLFVEIIEGNGEIDLSSNSEINGVFYFIYCYLFETAETM